MILLQGGFEESRFLLWGETPFGAFLLPKPKYNQQRQDRFAVPRSVSENYRVAWQGLMVS